MTVVELTRDITRRREAASIQGSYLDAETGAWMLNTEFAGSYGRTLARQLFPEVAAQISEPATSGASPDFRPIDLATGWFNGLTEQDIAAIYGDTPKELLDKLYPYQRIDLTYVLARLKQDGCGYLGWEMGLGKTLGYIAIMLALGVWRVVVVCPNASKETVHRGEIAKWAGDTYTVFNYGGTKAKRDQELKRWRECDGPAVLLVHYEGLRLANWSFTDRQPVDLVVCDEAHRLAKGAVGGKVPQFYKALKSIKARARLALSGSIIINSAEDVFGALHWLAPTAYKSKWRDWNNRFIQYAEGPWGKIMLGLKPDKVQEMQTELATLMVVRRKVDELPGLPEKLPPTYLKVDLSPAQRKVYDELAQRFIAELPDGKEITAPTVLSQLTKLRQIATGLDLLGESFTDSAKLDLAVELIEDNLPHKTVVFAWHRASVSALAGRLSVPCVTVTGDTPHAKRTAAVEAFQNDPNVKVIIATIKTLGESVTLHAAADLIFLESSWTPADMQQAEDRIHRIGQKRRVSITHIVARDTVDETRVLPIVRNKAEMRALILGGK